MKSRLRRSARVRARSARPSPPPRPRQPGRLALRGPLLHRVRGRQIAGEWHGGEEGLSGGGLLEDGRAGWRRARVGPGQNGRRAGQRRQRRQQPVRAPFPRRFRHGWHRQGVRGARPAERQRQSGGEQGGRSRERDRAQARRRAVAGGTGGCHIARVRPPETSSFVLARSLRARYPAARAAGSAAPAA
jgi:hypothetical protein